MKSLKFDDIKKMSKEEKEKKLNELKLEMIKSRGNSSKIGNSKIKQIKKIIAMIMASNS